jgi:HEPN domain-containing protein
MNQLRKGNLMNKTVKNWIATANYDLLTADAMYKTGRYLYVVFMCHLSIEKTLKAILAQKCPDDLPPKIHNLVNLTQKIELSLPDKIKDSFQRIDKCKRRNSLS